jgi:hypothetical protein
MNGTIASEYMQGSACAECAKLQYHVIGALEKFAELAITQLEACQFNDMAGFARLDKELELAVHEKERRIAALRQHCSDQHRTASAP